MATLAQAAGPFALGTFSAPAAAPFPGLLARDRVLDLSRALDWAPSGKLPDHRGHGLPVMP